jgi:asparagine synthase (glutamine-hydrolysing)
VSRRITFSYADGEAELAYSGPAPPAGEVVCLLDGFLDNAAELAAELGLAGPAPLAEELLALAYRRWGTALPGRMRGDFVLVVWDKAAREGLIARDQLGVRPAYLWRSGRHLRCSTDLALLLAGLPRRPAPDRASVAHWIAAGSRPDGHTLYAGVERLRPGGMVVLGRGGRRLVRYWEPRYEEPLDLPAAELAERVRAGLEVAVGRRLAADAPSAVLLSGGLDSAAVAATAVALGTGEVRACSGSFPDHPAADEAGLIAELRERLGLTGPIARVRAGGLLGSAAEYLAATGLPLLSWGDFWTLPLMREAAGEGVANVLGGDGGDELFGPRQNAIAAALRAGRPRRALALANELPGAGPHLPRREVAAMLAAQAEIALPSSVHARIALRREARGLPPWLRPEARRELLETDDPTAWRRLDGPLWWGEIAHGVADQLDQAGIFENLRLRAALAGVEARHPLLDLDLVELALRQPPEATLDPRFTRPILREAVAGLVPDAVRLRPAKARFESVVADCLTGPELPALRALLLDPEAELRAYVDQRMMERQLFDGGGGGGGPEIGSFRWMWLAWRAATAELWLRAEREAVTVTPGPTHTTMAVTSV